MSDSQFLIGKLVDGRGEPDAIHIATMPVTAAETLKPGQHIGFKDEYRVTGNPPSPYKLLGIVDPFLRADDVGADYHEMMQVAASHCDENKRWGDYLCEGGKWEGQSTPDEFWTHYAAVTGKVPKGGPTGIFSCSC